MAFDRNLPWAQHDQSEEYPHELHAALAKDGWIGIALPKELGGTGLGISEACMMLQTISEYDFPCKKKFFSYDVRMIPNFNYAFYIAALIIHCGWKCETLAWTFICRLKSSSTVPALILIIP